MAETAKSLQVKTGAGRFPLVHKLIQFADIRRHYKDMREALIASNRQAGSYKGWVTRWKKKYEASELAQKKLEIEIAQHLADKQELADQIREISEKFQGMGTTLAKLEAFEAAVDNLSEMKSVVDEQQHRWKGLPALLFDGPRSINVEGKWKAPEAVR